MENSKATILVVDDVAANIEILNGVLGNQYDVLFATNGLDAVEIAREQNLDLILLDVMMPGLDGYGVCSLLKNEEKTMDIPVIFVNRSISRKLPTVCTIDDTHFSPMILVSISLFYPLLSINITSKISNSHPGIMRTLYRINDIIKKPWFKLIKMP